MVIMALLMLNQMFQSVVVNHDDQVRQDQQVVQQHYRLNIIHDDSHSLLIIMMISMRHQAMLHY